MTFDALDCPTTIGGAALAGGPFLFEDINPASERGLGRRKNLGVRSSLEPRCQRPPRLGSRSGLTGCKTPRGRSGRARRVRTDLIQAIGTASLVVAPKLMTLWCAPGLRQSTPRPVLRIGRAAAGAPPRAARKRVGISYMAASAFLGAPDRQSNHLTNSIPKLGINRGPCISEGGVSIMRASYASLVLAFAVASVLKAAAQTLPWPINAAPAGAAGLPAAVTPAPMRAGVPAPMSAAPFGVGGQPPPCVTVFGKLRDEVQKKGAAAKDASEHKVAREKMCQIVQAYSAVEGKWLKFAEAGVSTCGIPREVVNQLKQVHARTERARMSICSAGAPAAPGLSDALDAKRLPPDTKKFGANTFDTLTGNVLQR